MFATDGSGNGGFGIASEHVKIAKPLLPFIVSGINYPEIIYDKSKPKSGTNNRAELLAILYLTHYLETIQPKDYIILADSQYCINIYEKWYHNWVLTYALNGKANLDIIELTVKQLDRLKTLGYTITFQWQRGHLTKKAILALSPEARIAALLNQEADRLAELGSTIL